MTKDERLERCALPVAIASLFIVSIGVVGCLAKQSEHLVQRNEVARALDQRDQMIAVRDQALAMLATEIQKLQKQMALLQQGRYANQEK